MRMDGRGGRDLRLPDSREPRSPGRTYIASGEVHHAIAMVAVRHRERGLLARIARALTENAMSRAIIPPSTCGPARASCGSIGDRDGRRQDRSAW